MMFDSAIATASPLPSIDENSVLVPSTTDGLSHVGPQTVQLYCEVSGDSLGRKVPIPRQCDWGKVVAALHRRPNKGRPSETTTKSSQYFAVGHVTGLRLMTP